MIPNARRSALDFAAEEGPVHLRPIYTAVRDHGCDLAIIKPGAEPLDLPPAGAPLIAVVCDDFMEAVGPKGFDRASLVRAIAGCKAAVVVSSGPEPAAYAAPCTHAVLRRESVCIVETRPAQEIQWVHFLREAQPKLKLLICCPRGPTA